MIKFIPKLISITMLFYIKQLKGIHLFSFSCMLAFGCKNVYPQQKHGNQSKYIVSIGDTVRIYYSVSPCCKYCQPNSQKLAHLEYIGSQIVIDEKEKCDGCNHITALLFLAKSKGTDVLKGGIISPFEACNDTISGLNQYSVIIQ